MFEIKKNLVQETFKNKPKMAYSRNAFPRENREILETNKRDTRDTSKK